MAVLLPDQIKLYFLVWQSQGKNTVTHDNTSYITKKKEGNGPVTVEIASSSS
jgi:hypothetical protein